jgi:hypothetical protein
MNYRCFIYITNTFLVFLTIVNRSGSFSGYLDRSRSILILSMLNNHDRFQDSGDRVVIIRGYMKESDRLWKMRGAESIQTGGGGWMRPLASFTKPLASRCEGGFVFDQLRSSVSKLALSLGSGAKPTWNCFLFCLHSTLALCPGLYFWSSPWLMLSPMYS